LLDERAEGYPPRLRALLALGSSAPTGPREEKAKLTSQGHPRAVFQRAVERGNLLTAEMTAREIGVLSLEDALRLTVLVAEKAPARLEAFTSRWLRRYLEEHSTISAVEVGFVSSSLQALSDERTRQAAAAALDRFARR
jgi:hypothetical protein